MNTTKNILTASILALTLIAPAAVAEPVEVHVSAAGLDFAPQANLAAVGYHLSVTGPDGYLASETFKAGQPPYFDAAGLEDGAYNWELKAIPAKPASDERAVTAKSGPLASGGFHILGGAPVDPTVREHVSAKSVHDGVAEKAQVFTTDLIVQGSGCIGFDCTSSESFGFDTLRLKENNLRIHFNDTSSSASFPGNDWRLIANDSSNGGANYLAIEDATAGRTPFKVEAGSIANALYVDEDGDVGVGTSNPVVEVHSVDGNTPTLRLEQDGSNGFTPQTWDLAGNETNFFIRDVTGGSKLPFRIKPGAPDDSIFITASGAVGIGTDSPDGVRMQVEGALRVTDADTVATDRGSSGAVDYYSGSTRFFSWGADAGTNGGFQFISKSANGSGNITPLSVNSSGYTTLTGLTSSSLDTGSNTGTAASLCTDTNGNLCLCGSCA